MIKRKFKGFTLAEVLITLAILGIIASLTIPNVFQNINNEQLKISFKKNYSEFFQVTGKIKQDNSGTLAQAFSGLTDDEIMDKFLNYMSYIKKCPEGQDPGICWHNANNFKYLKGTAVNNAGTYASRAILSNGSFFLVDIWEPACTDIMGTVRYVCGEIKTDVNGFKGPNVYGRDIYSFVVTKNGLSTWSYEDCNSTSNGTNCARKVLKNESY